MHNAIIELENQFFGILRVAVLDRFYCIIKAYNKGADQSVGLGWSVPLLFTNLRKQVFSRRGPYYLKKIMFNPFKPNGISHSYQLDQSISVFRVVGWYFSFLFKFQNKLL